MRRIIIAIATPVVLGLFLNAARQPRTADTPYLPLEPGLKWVLKNPSERKPVIFEVISQEGDSTVVRSTTPWGMSEWGLSATGNQYVMTSYGTGGPMMQLPKRPLYLDFDREPGSKWTSQLGALVLVSRTVEVHSANRTYDRCIQIRQKAGGNLLFTFAKGVGYVQFGEGSHAFILDESSSVLPGGTLPREPRRPPEPQRPPEESSPTGPPPSVSTGGSGPLIGITPNRFANEPMTVEVMMSRFRQTLDAGATFLVGNAKWAEVERGREQYSLEGMEQFLSAAAGANLPVSFTLRGIDTIAKDVPADLRQRAWSDPAMRERVLHLIDRMVPLLRGHARWFMFGYEIDGYLSKHPEDVRGFAELHRLVRERVRQLAPEIQVSTTLTFPGLQQLEGVLAPLNQQLDFIALTYCPLKSDFRVEDPSVVPADFKKMKSIAGRRKIVFQEIGYPTAAATGSSDERQAEFYRLALNEISSDPTAFAAVNFMTLADLADTDAQQFASFYGLPHHEAFRGTLQTLGLFDKHGHAKPSWDILTARVRELQTAKRIR